MKKRIIFGLIIGLLLVGCDDSSSNFDILINNFEKCEEKLDRCNRERSQGDINLRFDYIHETKLLDETREWCYLIVTNGTTPDTCNEFECKKRLPIRTWNLETDYIKDQFFDGEPEWKYWLVCDTRYR